MRPLEKRVRSLTPLRDKIEKLIACDVDRRCMELLLERRSMSPDDLAYINKLWEIVKDVEIKDD